MFFKLPSAINDLVSARNELRERYSHARLTFTLDGKLVGDIGEAVASELFGLRLEPGEGIDGYAPDGRSVQVKASGSNRGALFRPVDKRADHLIFLLLDYESCSGEVVYNGPEAPVIKHLVDNPNWASQRPVSLFQLRRAAKGVETSQMLRTTK